ncbi:beta-carotene 15,15'-dioxygenase, Brp/Blh family [Mycobacterium sp.]|uniref:beta-carotene 15,15'-dioxygenase, Brp/Blh family n=1 Tax=Mycobacterium sp. TaxID=1785 RepID=UPI0031D4B2CA
MGGTSVGMPAVPAPLVLLGAALGLVAGIPHGAADHVLAVRVAGGRSLAVVAAVYAGATAVVWALLEWAGLIALIAVVALSAVHFGLGELEFTRHHTGWRPPSLAAVSIAIAGSGALLLPLARCGDQLGAVADAVSPGLVLVVADSSVRIVLLSLWLLAAVVAVISSLRSDHPGVALDVATIGALGLLVPPLAAFAVWFGGWHALRHCARMMTIEPGCAALVSRGRLRSAVLRLARLAAPPSIAAVATLAAVVCLSVTASTPVALLAELVRMLLALTVPHMLVVLWVDRDADRRAMLTARE